MKMKTYKLLVEVTVPTEVDERRIKSYVRTAVGCWGGQYHPEDPLFDINKPVSVKNAVRALAARRGP